MKKISLILVVFTMVHSFVIACCPMDCCDDSVKTKTMDLVYTKDGTINSLMDKYTRLNWINTRSLVFDLKGNKQIKPSLVVIKMDDESIKLVLTLFNESDSSLTVEPSFPFFNDFGLKDISKEHIYHLFPRQGEMPNNIDSILYEEIYSGSFPFQFMDISKEGDGGICVMTQDLTNYPKKYFLKRVNGKFNFGVTYRSKVLKAKESWTLPPVILYAHSDDWHEALFYYRDWLKENLSPVTARKDWFRDVYNFRQLFLHREFGEDGAFDPVTKKIDLVKKVNESIDAFGGVDYVHLFDWGRTPEKGRCGDYLPWEYLGGKEQLQSEVRKIKKRGIRVGIYHEGYLLSPNSDVCKQFGTQWQMLTRDGKRYDRFGTGYYYPCPFVPAWREYLGNTVKRTAEEVGANGIYIDQYGFGWQYGCFNPAHEHDIRQTGIKSELQVQWEGELMAHIRQKLPKEIVSYTEECPTDVSTQYQDGSFSYAVSIGRSRARHNPSVVNLARFAFPDYKLIEILHVDSRVGNDFEGILHTFFNGEGLWIEGPLNDPQWFPTEVRELIKKCYLILRDNKEAFRTLNPVPLVPTLNKDVYSNYFPSKTKNVWTLRNLSTLRIDDELLEVPHIEGCRYYDAWNNIFIDPVIKENVATIKLKLEGNGAGCLIQFVN